jgi:hypothetical protein
LFSQFPKLTPEFPVSEQERKKLRNGIYTPVQLPTGSDFGPGVSFRMCFSVA